MLEIDIGGGRKIQLDIPEFKPQIVLIGFAVVGVLVGVLTSIYTIKAEEEGVVLRFGKYQSTQKPGLHFKMPFFIDKVEKVAVLRQQKQEYGFGTPGNTNRSQWSGPSEQEKEKKMVTGDLNGARVDWVIQYRITEPRDYLFMVKDPDSTLRNATESVMREVVGDRTVDEVITIGRQDIERESLEKLKVLVNKYKLGVSIDQIQLIDVKPPERVEDSFNEVNRAEQEKATAVNVANGEYNQKVPKAAGVAQQDISRAEGYATKRINEAEGDAGRFIALLEAYQEAPEVTRRRMYLETMQKVMPQLERKIIMDEEGNQVLPLMQLNQGGIQR
ncbi:MAG: FtsH protease activity modulator HflK [Roseibacillus sp.]|nr:FtsH protease activity modulator HflK [Roseibacillus sp.]